MYDLAIIGCGPVGALAANFLGQAGLNVLVLEKELRPYPLPRAVHIDHEMMRMFQATGTIDAILPDMRDTEGHLHIGSDKGVLRYMGTRGKPRPFGWSNDYFFYQPELEDHLRAALERFANVKVIYGAELTGLTTSSTTQTLMFKASEQAQSVEARWVIACDGARSIVRKSLGIELDDLQFEEPWLVVDAEVDGPVRFDDLKGVPEDADLQALSVMMCDPVRPATVVPGRGNHRRWELMLLPGEDDAEMATPSRVSELLAPWLEGVPHRIVRSATYRFHGLVAKHWRKDGVFLAGDAAHQTPPFFGQGMCHGFRDVINLAWKMELIHRSEADESLLETYQTEREPHVRSVIAAAVAAGRYICVLDPVEAAERDTKIREQVARGELPATAGDLIPAIAVGVVSDSRMAGKRFIQPFVNADGNKTLLDNTLPYGWQCFVSATEMLVSARKQAAELVPALSLTVTAADTLNDDGAVTAWLQAADADIVIVRPDFYVYATGRGNLAKLLQHLSTQLGLTQRVMEEIV